MSSNNKAWTLYMDRSRLLLINRYVWAQTLVDPPDKRPGWRGSCLGNSGEKAQNNHSLFPQAFFICPHLSDFLKCTHYTSLNASFNTIYRVFGRKGRGWLGPCTKRALGDNKHGAACGRLHSRHVCWPLAFTRCVFAPLNCSSRGKTN